MPPSSTEVLDYLFTHRLDFLRTFLRQKHQPVSGTSEVLRARFETLLRDRETSLTELLALLDRIEGWGNQHIYLFSAPLRLCREWRKDKHVRSRLKAAGHLSLLNRARPILLPPRPTLSSIEWTDKRVRFVWIERRLWEERLDEEHVEGDTVWRAFRQHTGRGVISFDWDLLTGEAALLIQKLPTGSGYTQLRDSFLGELEPVFPVSTFNGLLLSKALSNLPNSGEVRLRQLEHRTIAGGRAQFVSQSKKRAVKDDPGLRSARAALGNGSIAHNNIYWLPLNGHLLKEVHVKLYARDHRVAVFGAHIEQDIRYVIARIRTHCS